MPHQFTVEIEQCLIADALAVRTASLHYVGNCLGSSEALIFSGLLAPHI